MGLYLLVFFIPNISFQVFSPITRDILVSKNTTPNVSGKGIVGHAGIVIGSNSVLLIAGYGYKPEIYTLDK